MAGNQTTQVIMRNVQDVVPTSSMKGVCVLDSDIAAAANPDYILIGGNWAQSPPESPEPKTEIVVVMSRMTDVNGEQPGYFVTANYINALLANGAKPVLVDYDQDPEALAEQYPGLMLIGGLAEFPNEWYGANPTSPYKNDDIGTKRATFETRMLNAFMAAGKPVLGICNGMQVMAASRGATLTGSIKTSFPEAASHCGADAAHAINILPGTVLSAIFESCADGGQIEMTSFHNEAVMSVPAGGDITVNAYSPEGIVEGIELAGGHPFTIGIQGHPEHYSAGIRKGEGDRIITAFIAECSPAP